MKVLLLESFYGGSHQDVADSIVSHSIHDITLLTLPARFWKWRMRGAALYFAEKINFDARFDLILCTGLMDVAAFKALLGPSCPPILLYCHETQLAYPQPRESEADLHFAFTDLVNMLVADKVLFNSKSHLQRFLDSLPPFLRKLPEFRPMWTVDAVSARCDVCYPGIRAPSEGLDPQEEVTNPDPLVIWNHRWEFDKAPAEFFAALRALMDRGIEFRVAILGENFNTVPQEFPQARRELGHRVVHYGYVTSRPEYEAWLGRGDVVVSTAIQENFGVSVMEAIAHGCHPVLPDRLSYPEIIPQRFHADCIYSGPEAMVDLLAGILLARRRADADLVSHARSFRWTERIHQFDQIIGEFARPAGE